MKNSSRKISIVSGGAGFVGTNLCIRLLNEDRLVVVIDNFSRGKLEYLQNISVSSSISNKLIILTADLSNRMQCENSFMQIAALGIIDEVWHLAANSDIPAGVFDSDVDYKDTFLTTYEILRVIKMLNIPKIHFASSSAIYGDLGNLYLYENIGPLNPISNYGAMKLASESIISALVENGITKANIFRFPNVVGIPATHGVILDFLIKLKTDKFRLDVLGDGTQKKAYMHVSDLVDAMLFVRSLSLQDKFFSINIGPIDDGVSVSWIASNVVSHVSPTALINFGRENKGWVGDVPKFTYSVDKLLGLGWRPTLNSENAVLRAINEISVQLGFFDT